MFGIPKDLIEQAQAAIRRISELEARVAELERREAELFSQVHKLFERVPPEFYAPKP